MSRHTAPGSALWAHEQGDLAPWNLEAQLLRECLDVLRVIRWQNTSDAQPSPKTGLAPALHYPPPTWWPGSGLPRPAPAGSPTSGSPTGRHPERADLAGPPSTRTDVDRVIAAETRMTLAEADSWLGWTD